MSGNVKTLGGRLKTKYADGVADARLHDQALDSEDGETADETTTDGSDTASPPHLHEYSSCDHVYMPPTNARVLRTTPPSIASNGLTTRLCTRDRR
jgi:hypothetical protein